MSIFKKTIILLLCIGCFFLFYFQYNFYGFLILPALVFVFYYRKFRKAFYISLYFLQLLFKKNKQSAELTASNNNTKIISLKDGRQVSYQTFGALDGTPIFYFHGAPSSAGEAALISQPILLANNLTVISLDRPGIGMSDFKPKRTFLNWAEDVAEVADILNINQFSVLGFSGGGPYVAACAYYIPQRLTAAVIISGAWQMQIKEAQQNIYESVRLFWKVAYKAPLLLPYILKGLRPDTVKVSEADVEGWKQKACEVDFEFLHMNDGIGCLKRASIFALNNIQAITKDVLMYVKKWDFDPSLINYPVTILHGQLDRNVPAALVKKYGGLIKNATLKLYENEGHYSILGNQLADVVFAITGKPAMLPEHNTAIVIEEEQRIV